MVPKYQYLQAPYGEKKKKTPQKAGTIDSNNKNLCYLKWFNKFQSRTAMGIIIILYDQGC